MPAQRPPEGCWRSGASSSADHPGRPLAGPSDPDRSRIMACPPREGQRQGQLDRAARAPTTPSGRWRSSFLRMPYQRDAVYRSQPDRRDLRDGLHLGPLRRAARGDHDGGLRGDGGAERSRSPHLPLHPRLPRRPRALLRRLRLGAVGLPGVDVGPDQDRRLRGDHRPRRDDRPTTTRSDGTTHPGMTDSGQSRSPPRCAQPRPPGPAGHPQPRSAGTLTRPKAQPAESGTRDCRARDAPPSAMIGPVPGQAGGVAVMTKYLISFPSGAIRSFRTRICRQSRTRRTR